MVNGTESRLQKQKNFLVGFSYWSVIIFGVLFLWECIGSVLTPFIIAFLIAYILNYPVQRISKKTKLNHSLIAITCVIVFYVFSSLAIILAGTRIFLGAKELFSNLPTLFTMTIVPIIENIFNSIEKLIFSLDPALIIALEESSATILQVLSEFISKMSTHVLGTISGIATSIPGIFLKTMITIIVTFFMTIDFDRIVDFIKRQLSKKTRCILKESKNFISATVFRCIGSYAIIMGMTFAEIWIGLSIIGIPNALGIAALIAVLDILPVLGTGGIMIPWAIIALIYGNYKIGIGIGLLYLIIMVVRNTVEPKLVGQQVGLHPIVTLLSMLIGVKCFGIIGLLGCPILLSLVKNLNDNKYVLSLNRS